MLVIFCALVAIADFRLSAVLSDSMVLQRESRVNLWGWADPGEAARIQAEWMKSAVIVTANGHGQWHATLKTSKAGGPYTIVFQEENKVAVQGMLPGELV
jgi:sialate O-acetylesterase